MDDSPRSRRRRNVPARVDRAVNPDELRDAVRRKVAEVTANDLSTIVEMASSAQGLSLDSVVACSVLSALSARYGLEFDVRRMRRDDLRSISALERYVYRTAFPNNIH